VVIPEDAIRVYKEAALEEKGRAEQPCRDVQVEARRKLVWGRCRHMECAKSPARPWWIQRKTLYEGFRTIGNERMRRRHREDASYTMLA
jgi:hypothetical protein